MLDRRLISAFGTYIIPPEPANFILSSRRHDDFSERNMMRSWLIICALAVILALWRMNVFMWPWHLIFEWSGGLSAVAVAGVTLNALHRENSKNPGKTDDNLFMFIAIVAVSILTLSALLNFLLFVL
jgi:hypothetical protein